jgi:Zn-finger nucleic acid-binding protein
MKVEQRLPCPSCIGVKLKKARLGDRMNHLVLDYCERCGGMWFDVGEVLRLRREHGPAALFKTIKRRERQPVMQCHVCHVQMKRNEPVCGACGWHNELDCPSCQRAMTREEAGGVLLDRCRKCNGVWFDHSELALIWRMQMPAQAQPTAAANDNVALDSILWDPELFVNGLSGAGRVVADSLQALNEVGSLLEAGQFVAEASAHVFGIIVGILEGLG